MPLSMQTDVRRHGASVLRALASRHLTILFFLITGAASLVVAYDLMEATPMMVAPFVLLTLNLVAGILVHARFRSDLPLLLFHLALVVLVSLFVFARLVYLDARTTLTSGTEFDGQLQMEARGPLHFGRVQDLRFANDGFTEDFYARGRGKYFATHNYVRWQDDAGQWHPARISDDRPLILNGYKIYPTERRGYSPVFLWQPASGEEKIGTVQMSGMADTEYATAVEWEMPTGGKAWLMLEAKTQEEKPNGARVGLATDAIKHRLVLRIGEQRHVLQEGQGIALPEGRLTYMRLDSWMGYIISYDPTVPWIMATILIGVASLVWFYWRRIW